MEEKLYLLQRHLPELLELDALIRHGERHLRVTTVHQVPMGQISLPIHVIELGSQSPNAPVIGFFGGVHGVERIGSQVLMSWLHSLIHRLQWDDQLHRRLEKVRLVFMPMINPGGIWQRTRRHASRLTHPFREGPGEHKDELGRQAGPRGHSRAGPGKCRSR